MTAPRRVEPQICWIGALVADTRSMSVYRTQRSNSHVVGCRSSGASGLAMLALGTSALVLLTISGCNMVAGAGRDITNMSSSVQGWINPTEGEHIQNASGEETLPQNGSSSSPSSGSSDSSSRRATYQPNL